MSIVFVISGSSGSGKSSLIALLLRLVSGLDFSVSYTTRPRRASERDGHDYFFVSREKFERMIAAGEFLEYVNVFAHYYGTSCRFLDQAKEKGHDLLLDVDVQGASQVKEKISNTVSIFVVPPKRHELEWRLRMHFAHAAARQYDYVLINDEQLEKCADELRKIVLSERKRRSS